MLSFFLFNLFITSWVGAYALSLFLTHTSFFDVVMQEHAWFCSSRFVELVELLLGLKSPEDIALLQSRFTCFRILLVHSLKV